MKVRSFCRGGVVSLSVLALSSLHAPYAAAQTNTTALSGTVTDPSGALVPGATVTITDVDSGKVTTTRTRSKGEYAFEQLPPGHYRVDVTAAGGFSEQQEDVQLLVSTPLTLKFKLSIGTSEIVTVDTGSISAINETDATLGKAFDSQQVQNLPYLANNITYLLSLQPGVLGLDSGALTGGLNTDTRTGIVDGARQDQTNVTLDGVDDNDQTNGYAFNGALRSTRESVEEFRVTTTNGNADSGRSSGAQVSLVTRSGTNTVHGSAYEYYRSSIGLSNNWFNKQRQLNVGQANIPQKVLQHTYGASLGAPILKDRFFFFGAYEGFKQASDGLVTEIVPSVLGGGGLYTGNVSYLTSSGAVQTLTPAEIATLYAPQKDSACMTQTCTNPMTDPAVLTYLKSFPLANGNNGGDSYNTGSYSFTSPAPIHQITNIARLDYKLSGKQQLFVRGNLQSDNSASTLQFPGLAANSNVYGNNKGIAAGDIWNISSSLINNFRYGLVRQGATTRGAGSAPYTSFAAFSPITGTTTSSIYLVRTDNFADDLTWVKGRHIVQAGINDRVLRNSRYFDSPLQNIVSISQNLLATAGIANKGGTLDPSAFAGTPGCPDCAPVASSFRTFYNNDILANTGRIENAQTGTEYLVKNGVLVPQSTAPTHVYHNIEQEYYIQDQWKATTHLTVTAGVRYAYYGTPYEINGQQIAPTVTFDSILQSRTTAAAQGGAYTTPVTFGVSGAGNGAANFWSPQKLNFAPKFAFAYTTPDNKTSIRGGYALAFDHFGEGVIDYYDSGAGALLSLSKQNQSPFSDVNTNPVFSGYGVLPPGTNLGSTATVSLPNTPANNVFTFDRGIYNNIKTPYAETFNLSVQQEFGHGFTSTLSYVGRLGRHLPVNLDAVQPTNVYDPVSGLSYFQAATAFDKMVDAGTPPSNVPDSGYFHNIFPLATYAVPKTNIVYTGAQAYYAYLYNGDRGNETDPLFEYDTPQGSTPAASGPGGKAYQFFFPQVSSVYAQSTIANSGYNALQASVRQALRHGIVYDLNYTWSKSRDMGSSPERSASNLITNTFNPKGNYAPSDFDVRHNVTADYTLPLPFGKGGAFLTNANRLLDELIGGWQINGVAHYSTGFPFSAVASGVYGTNFDSSSYFVQTGAIPTGGHQYNRTGHYETSLKNGFTPAQAFANLRYAYAGETGQRNNFRADGYLSLDDSVAKSFHTFREQSFRIQVDVFNVINANRFNSFAMTTNGASTTFGQYTGNTSTTSGLLVQPRQMQFSGKYSF